MKTTEKQEFSVIAVSLRSPLLYPAELRARVLRLQNETVLIQSGHSCDSIRVQFSADVAEVVLKRHAINYFVRNNSTNKDTENQEKRNQLRLIARKTGYAQIRIN